MPGRCVWNGLSAGRCRLSSGQVSCWCVDLYISISASPTSLDSCQLVPTLSPKFPLLARALDRCRSCIPLSDPRHSELQSPMLVPRSRVSWTPPAHDHDCFSDSRRVSRFILITPSLAHAGVTASAATTPHGMWSMAPPATVAPSLRSKKNPASCHHVLLTIVKPPPSPCSA